MQLTVCRFLCSILHSHYNENFLAFSGRTRRMNVHPPPPPHPVNTLVSPLNAIYYTDFSVGVVMKVFFIHFIDQNLLFPYYHCLHLFTLIRISV